MATGFAEQVPKAFGSDGRIRHVIFNPNEVYEIKATYGFQTTLEFAESETIQVASIGDSIAWQVVPVKNKLFLKPVETKPKTNLTVVTNKRTYYFHLTTLSVPDKAEMTYLVRFEYPTTPSTSDKFFEAKPLISYNFDYQLKGDKKSGLIRAFDNGEFTYLQFKNVSDLPAIFLVDEKREESVVNYRIEGVYVVIERIGEEFLLRRGKKVGRLINKRFAHSDTSQAPQISKMEVGRD